MQTGTNSKPIRHKPHLARKTLPQKGDKQFGHSRLTNGRDLLPGVDGRSTWARLMRDVMASMMSHLGGEDYATEPQRMLVRRVAAFEAELVHLENGFAIARAEGRAPDPSELDLYSRMASAQRRHLEAIGLQRVPRDVIPHPLDYAREYARRKEATA